jgi:hypothetical protein
MLIIKSALDTPTLEEGLLCLKENVYETHSHTEEEITENIQLEVSCIHRTSAA